MLKTYHRDINLQSIIIITISAIISFAISMFISDKFKFSNNKIIKNLQKFVLMNIILALISGILYFWGFSIFSTIFNDNGDSDTEDNNNKESNNNEKNNNEQESFKDKNKDVVGITTNINKEGTEYYNFNIRKDIVDNTLEKGKDFLKSGLTNVAPDIGIGAAAGKVASEVFKHTAGMPGPARLASVTLAAGGTAFGTKVGIEMGKAMVSNDKKLKEIEASKVDTDSDSEGRNSPSNFDGGFIHSVLDESEIPLIIMVNGF